LFQFQEERYNRWKRSRGWWFSNHC